MTISMSYACTTLVQLPAKECPLSGLLEGLDIGHDLCHGLGCPFERMSSVVPLFDVEIDFVAQILDRGEVWDLETLALEDAEPLLDLVHP